jgi:hypothetical protein
MSERDFYAVVGRWNVDFDFASQLMNNFEKAVQDGQYSLEAAEMQRAKAMFSAPKGSSSGPQPESDSVQAAQPAMQAFTPEQMRQLRTAQVKRGLELGRFGLDLLKQTLGYAKQTYRAITLMNQAMFVLGFGLFLFAAVYGVISKNLQLTAVFGGLGVASFVTIFLITPIDKTQNALSNLIQAEVVFTNYFEQMAVAEALAQTNLEGASELLQKRSERAIWLLQAYLGRPVKEKSENAAAAPETS